MHVGRVQNRMNCFNHSIPTDMEIGKRGAT
jgi:hypothetical protein